MAVKPLAMRDDDEGELTIAIASDPSGQIVIDFGKSIHWLAMPKEMAREFALNILRRAVGTKRVELSDDDPLAVALKRLGESL